MKLTWNISGVDRVPRAQWDALCAAAQRVFDMSEGSQLVYGSQRTSGPTTNQSAVRCGMHPKFGANKSTDMVLKRSGSGEVEVPHERRPGEAAAMFAVLQCAHEILKDPTKLEWDTDTMPKPEWLELAQRALHELPPGYTGDDHDGDTDNSGDADPGEWDNDSDSGDSQDADADADSDSDQDSDEPPQQGNGSQCPPDAPDIFTTVGALPMQQVADMMGVGAESAPDLTPELEALETKFHDSMLAHQTEVDRKIAAVQAPTRIVVDAGNGDEPKPVEGYTHRRMPEVLEYLQAGINVMLVGPAGSGKTTLAAQCAEALGREFAFTGALLQKYELLGYQDAGGTYHATPFRKAFEHGFVYLWDELDASNPQAAVAFNAALENPFADFPDAIVQRHPDFVAIAAANTFGHGANRQYVGRNALDGATLDRFAVVELGYDQALEAALAGNDEWVSKVWAWRDACDQLGIKHIISQRASIKGARLITRGVLTEDQIADALVFKGLDREQRDKIRERAGV